MTGNELFLIVEDDKQIRSFISFSLKSKQYRSVQATTGKEAINLIASPNFDVMILDLGLPDIDGLDIIKRVRSFSDMPIVVVSARDQESDKIEALNAGADDYLTKPFSINELLARLRVILRHLSLKEANHATNIYQIGEPEVNLDRQMVLLSESEIHFTPMEFNVLTLLIRNAGKVLTHNYIINEVWGSSLESDKQSLRVFMANIRRKLEIDPIKPRYIITEIGIGYRFADE